MYFPYFIAYMGAGLVVSLVVFLWALKNGQFREQQRARYLPLEAEGREPVERISRWKRLETYTLFFLAGVGLLTSAALVTFALMAAP